MDPSSLFSRAEVLGGLTDRRARTLLFLIECRSARLAAQARQAMAPFRSEQTAADDELAFITAFTEGRDPPLKPSIQDLEHFAAQWAHLVPREPRMQAAVAHALGATDVEQLTRSRLDPEVHVAVASGHLAELGSRRAGDLARGWTVSPPGVALPRSSGAPGAGERTLAVLCACALDSAAGPGILTGKCLSPKERALTVTISLPSPRLNSFFLVLIVSIISLRLN
jgi:hypothetical protein